MPVGPGETIFAGFLLAGAVLMEKLPRGVQQAGYTDYSHHYVKSSNYVST